VFPENTKRGGEYSERGGGRQWIQLACIYGIQIQKKRRVGVEEGCGFAAC